MHLDRRAARAAHLQPASVRHRRVRARAHFERHRRERRLADRPGGPEQLQPETAWILPPLVGSHLGRWPLSSRPRPTHHAAARVALCHSRLLVRREGNGPPTGRLRCGPVHRLLRQLPPPHEFGLERVDWFVDLPRRGPSVPRPARPRVGRRFVSPVARGILVPAIGILVVLGNARNGLFAGAVGTQSALLEVLPAIGVLAAFAVAGYQLVRRTTNRTNDLVVSMLVAPVALIVFGLLHGLDPEGLLILYRSIDFLDYAFAVLIGVAFVAAWRWLGPRKGAKAVLVVGLLVALLATTPMAWNTPAVFGVENVTTPQEFRALALLASFGARNVTTDQRLADVGAMWFGYATDSSLPVKLRDNRSVGGFEYGLILERWTRVGAQMHPAPNIILAPEVLDRFLNAERIVYAAGAQGDRIFVVELLSSA